MSQIYRVDILGKSYPVNFSAHVLDQITDRWGGLTAMQEALTSKDGSVADKLKGSVYLIHALMEAGHALAVFVGETDVPDVPEFDLMCMVIPANEMITIQRQAFAAITASSKTTVETQPTKNTEATPES